MLIPLPTDKLMVTLELDIGMFFFYPNMVVSQMNEGVIVNFDNVLPVFLKGLQYYTSETPLVYISNRINSYSFDPTLHLEAREVFSNLKGYGVVVYNDMNLRIAKLEQEFINCPLRIFNTLEEARIWGRQVVQGH